MLTLFAIKFAPEISGIVMLIELFAVFAFFKGWFDADIYEWCYNFITKIERKWKYWNIN